jgi:hypothetical protein
MPSLSGKTIGTVENSFVEIQFDCGSSLGTLDLWGVQLEQNTTQTAFERESLQQTIAKCQRYYVDSGPVSFVSNSISVQALRVPVYFPVKMRSNPSIVPTDNAANVNKVFKGASNQTPDISAISTNGASIGSASAQSANEVYFTYTASAEL